MFCQVKKIKEGSRAELSSAENSSKMRIQDGSFWGENVDILYIYTHI